MRQAIELGVKVNIASGCNASSIGLQGECRRIGCPSAACSLWKRSVPQPVMQRNYWGWQDHGGAAEAGKYADLIAIEGDPLRADIGVLGQVECNEGW
jgi:hypothetical protein